MRPYKLPTELAGLTPDQRALLDTWIADPELTIENILKKFPAEFGKKLSKGKLERYIEHHNIAGLIEETTGTETSVEDLHALYNGDPTQIPEAALHRLYQRAFQIIADPKTKKSLLLPMFRIVTYKDRHDWLEHKKHIDLERVAIQHRREDTRETLAQLALDKFQHQKQQTRWGEAPAEPSPIPNSKSEIRNSIPKGKALVDQPERTNIIPLAGPNRSPHPGRPWSNTAEWDQQMFHVWGLTEPECQKRSLYNSMLDLGVPQDIAALYRDEILCQAGRLTVTTHYIPITHVRPTPAALHLPHFGAPTHHLKDLLWANKNNPWRYNKPEPTPKHLCPSADPSPSATTDQLSALNPGETSAIGYQLSAISPIQDPKSQIPDPNSEETYRKGRLRQTILALGLTPELTDAYIREILQLTHPDFIPEPTVYPEARNFSGAPAPTEHQKLVQYLYPYPSDIYLYTFRLAVNNRDGSNRWALGDGTPETHARMLTILPNLDPTKPIYTPPTWEEPEPSPENLCPSVDPSPSAIGNQLSAISPSNAPCGEHPIPDPKSQIQNPPSVPLCASPSVPSVSPPSHGPCGEHLEDRVNAYTCERYWEALRGRDPNIVGKHAAWNFRSKLQYCPCGHDLPCPEHGDFTPRFFECSSNDIYYIDTLAQKNLPYTSPHILLADQIREHFQQQHHATSTHPATTHINS